MIKAGLVGSTGYAGSELLRLLTLHPKAAAHIVTSHSYVNKKYMDVFENYRHLENIVCSEENIEELAQSCDVIFIALPHGMASKKVSKKVLSKTKVIDLGADFRLKDYKIYEYWYGVEHGSKELLNEAAYGLCEINREYIKKAQLVANPGCYTTCSILSLYPLLKEGIVDKDSIIIDAKSGVSGAGRDVNIGVHYCETNESVKAYKLASHRHTPEIEEQLSYGANQQITLTFTPHLIPMNRGILTTCYANLKEKANYEDIKKIYSKYYGEEYFIRICKKGQFPETKWVKGSNFFDIGFALDERTGRIIVIGTIDNLVKGAAGQAIQNMNIMFGLEENVGLDIVPPFPI